MPPTGTKDRKTGVWGFLGRVGISLLMVLLFLLVGRTLTTRSQGVCTVHPTDTFTEYYGDITVDGSASSIGTVVLAINSDGMQVGCFTVTFPGIYGYMRVYGKDSFGTPGMDINEVVAFRINGLTATSSPTNVTWSGDSNQHGVNLAAISAPTAVADLQAARSGNNIVLSWSDVGGTVDHYEVWRGINAYFTPDDAGATKLSESVGRPGAGVPASFTDSDGSGTVYYVVRGVNVNGDLSTASNQAGSFQFSLVPGSP